MKLNNKENNIFILRICCCFILILKIMLYVEIILI